MVCEGYRFTDFRPTEIVLEVFLPTAGSYVISINDNSGEPRSVELDGIELQKASSGANGAGLYMVTRSNSQLGPASLVIVYRYWNGSRFDGVTVTRL